MRILIVVHGFPPLSAGGTEVYAEAQARELVAMGDRVAVVTREADRGKPEYAARDEHRDGLRIRWINRTFRDVHRFAESYDSPSVTTSVADLVDEWRPDVAHIHHLTCLSTGIVAELKRRRIPVVLTLHDYWMLCHRGQLLDLDLGRCDDPRACRRCLGPAGAAGPVTFSAGRALAVLQRSVPAGFGSALRRSAERASGFAAGPAGMAHAERFEHMRAVLAGMDRILAPSRHMRERFARAGITSRIDLLEYGIENPGQPAREPRRDGALQLGFLGSLMVSKAPQLLIEAARRLPRGAAAVTVAGAFVPYHGDASYQRTLAPLLDTPGVVVTGPVAHAEVAHLLSRLDALVVPSIWEENSPLVIREAFAAGVPVVASRIGGIPEIVEDGVNGLLFEPGSVDDLARQLRRLIDEPGLLARLRAGIPPVRSIEAATQETRAIYEALVRPSGVSSRTETTARVAAVVLNYKTPDDTVLAVRSLLASRQAFSQVIVVDNSSDEECRRALADLAGEITFLDTGDNLGFSAGMNVGIRRALADGATHVLLVNSDVILPPRSLQALVGGLSGGPRRGIASPLIASRAEPGVVGSAGMRFSDRTGRMRHDAAGAPVRESRPAGWQPVDAVAGCAMLVSSDVFDAIGLLPEEYFFSFEDLAFCLAARDRGFDVGVVGDALAYHEGGRTMGPASVRRLYFASRNHLLAASSRPGGPLQRTFRAAAIVGYNAAHAFIAPGGTPFSRLGAVVRGVRDHLRGRYGPDDGRQA